MKWKIPERVRSSFLKRFLKRGSADSERDQALKKILEEEKSPQVSSSSASDSRFSTEIFTKSLPESDDEKPSLDVLGI